MRDNLALSILVVEDDNELRELLLEVLEEGPIMEVQIKIM
mgnify:CR=1 FL=1